MVDVKRLTSTILVIIGLLVIFGTHIMLLRDGLPQAAIDAHATINLIAASFVLIAYILVR